MTLPITIPYSFATATSSIPLAQLDSNFSAVASSISDIAGLNTRRNRIINGAMQVDQRNNGAAQTITNGYCVDRWIAVSGGASVTGQRVAGPSGYQYAYQFTGSAGITGIQFLQRIESFNCADLVNQYVTLTVNTSNSLLTAVNYSIYSADAIDNFSVSTLIASGAITVSSTATNYTVTFNAGPNAAKGLQVLFFVNSQTSGTWTITGVQLEAGSYATPFERQIYSDTLAQCQRYYFTDAYIFSGGTTTGNITVGQGLTFPVSMRITPSITFSAGSYINCGSWICAAGNKVSGLFQATTSVGSLSYLAQAVVTGNAEL